MGVTTYTDALGVTKEYREVKRPAKVGELVRAIGGVPEGQVFTVTYSDCDGVRGYKVSFATNARLYHSNYVVLEPTDIVIIDGKRYQTVRGRKAAVGDKILVRNRSKWCHCFELGTILPVIGVAEYDAVVVKGTSVNSGKTVEQYLHTSEYTVLQPIRAEATVVHEGVTYRTVSRLAQAGDLIQITDAQDHRVKNGEIYPVIEVVGQYVFVKHPQGRSVRHGGANIWPSKYVVLEKVSPPPATKSAPSDAERITALEDEVAQLKTEVATLKSQKPSTVTVTVPDLIAPLFVPSTPKLTREDIIRDAKRDVEQIVRDIYGKVDGGAYEVHRTPGHIITEFKVDRAKRTVTCLLKLKYASPWKVWKSATASCSPDDCFNVHIGKAIALYRALDKTVPTKYLTVPPPTEPKVGDIVLGIKGIARGITGRVSAMRPPGYFDANNGLLMDTVGHGPLWAYIERVKVIDDTGDGALQCGVLR